MIGVCFVCWANVCRSPTAEGIFRDLAARAGLEGCFAIDSAGMGARAAGAPPDAHCAETARARGIELAGAARPFDPRDFGVFDYLVAVDSENFLGLQALARGAEERAKVSLLRDFDPASEKGAEVPDPYQRPGGFDHVFDVTLAACRGLLEHLRRAHDLAR